MIAKGKGVKEKYVMTKADVNNAGLYSFFKLKNKELAKEVSVYEFGKIIRDYNNELISLVLQGKLIRLKANLGLLKVIEMERVVTIDEDGNLKGQLDFPAMRKYKNETGEWKYIYRTDPFWYRILWSTELPMRNRYVYKFLPSKAFKKSLSSKLNEDEEGLLKQLFRQNS